jgi:hypothetical protein
MRRKRSCRDSIRAGAQNVAPDAPAEPHAVQPGTAVDPEPSDYSAVRCDANEHEFDNRRAREAEEEGRTALRARSQARNPRSGNREARELESRLRGPGAEGVISNRVPGRCRRRAAGTRLSHACRVGFVTAARVREGRGRRYRRRRDGHRRGRNGHRRRGRLWPSVNLRCLRAWANFRFLRRLGRLWMGQGLPGGWNLRPRRGIRPRSHRPGTQEPCAEERETDVPRDAEGASHPLPRL